MCKLVENPKEIFPLIPILRPLVYNCSENISNPEARSIANRALKTLDKACSDSYIFKKKSKKDLESLLYLCFKDADILINDEPPFEKYKIDNIISIITNMYNIHRMSSLIILAFLHA